MGLGYPSSSAFTPAGRMNALPLTTGYSQPMSNPGTQFTPSAGASPLNAQSQAMPADSRKKKWLLWAGGLGTVGLAGLLALLHYKRPNLLKFWKGHRAEAAKTAEKPTEAALPAIPLKPLTFYNDKEAILQRHALSVEIVNELWPDVLKYAEHKPPGWEKVLEAKYNQILRKKLNLPERGRVLINFHTELGHPSARPSSCDSRLVPLTQELRKKEPFTAGALLYGSYATHFDPSCLQARQQAFTVLTHETNHLLRGLAQDEAQCGRVKIAQQNAFPLAGNSEGGSSL